MKIFKYNFIIDFVINTSLLIIYDFFSRDIEIQFTNKVEKINWKYERVTNF